MPKAPVWVMFEVDAQSIEEAEERVYGNAETQI
jgi:hypothetical protein